MTLPEELSVAEVSAWLNDASRPQPVVLDVRTAEEWDLAKLDVARLISLHELEERSGELEADKTRPFVVMCHHGVRSLYGAEYLRSLGYDATSMRGGIDAWSNEIDAAVPRY